MIFDRQWGVAYALTQQKRLSKFMESLFKYDKEKI
jgi:hypothetical protein